MGMVVGVVGGLDLAGLRLVLVGLPFNSLPTASGPLSLPLELQFGLIAVLLAVQANAH